MTPSPNNNKLECVRFAASPTEQNIHTFKRNATDVDLLTNLIFCYICEVYNANDKIKKRMKS